MEKFFVDGEGRFLGTFMGTEPEGGIQVPSAPLHASQRWVNGAWTAPPKFFPTLTSRQFWLAAANIGITKTSVSATIDTLALTDIEKELMKIEMMESTSFERDHPDIASLAVALGIPPEQLDDLWLWGASL